MRFIKADSKSNIIKKVINLNRRTYREKEGLFFIEGERSIEEGVNSEYNFSYIICTKTYAERSNLILQQFIDKKDVPVYLVEDNLMQAISNTITSQGILAVIKKRHFSIDQVLKKTKDYFILIIDGISDPGNLGTVIRTAHACNVDSVILNKGTVDIFNPKVLRSTAGSVFHIPFIYTADIVSIIQKLKNKGVDIIASHVNGTKYPYNLDMKKSLAIVLGNEAVGVSNQILTLADELVKIPMPGASESLNVAVACGIIMYEIVKQRSSVT